MSKFPPAFPAPLMRQQAMANARANEMVRPDDSASAVGSTGMLFKGTWMFRTQFQRLHLLGFDLGKLVDLLWLHQEDLALQVIKIDKMVRTHLRFLKFHLISSGHQLLLQPQLQLLKLLTMSLVLDSDRPRNWPSREIVRWGQLGPKQAVQNFQLPKFIQQLGAKENERSVLVLDNRDQRIQSPYHGWLLDEILLNASSGVSVLSDRNLIRSPNKGYHLNLFYVKTLEGFKVILAGSMTSYQCVPCAGWNAETAKVMDHTTFSVAHDD